MRTSRGTTVSTSGQGVKRAGTEPRTRSMESAEYFIDPGLVQLVNLYQAAQLARPRAR